MATLSQWQTAPVPTAQTDPKSKTAKPTKPLLKHTSVTAGKTRKRSEVSMDSDSLTDGPTPAKKARVSFNPKVEEKTMEAYSSKGRSIEGVKAEVRNAIEALHRGDATKYDAIKDVFADKDEADEDEETDDRAAIGTYLVALTSHISLLDRKCSGLVKAILGCEWLGRDEAFVRSYIRFLGHLASAHGQSVGMVLGMLVEHYAGGKPFFQASIIRTVSDHCSAPIQWSSSWLRRRQSRNDVFESTHGAQVPAWPNSLW